MMITNMCFQNLYWTQNPKGGINANHGCTIENNFETVTKGNNRADANALCFALRYEDEDQMNTLKVNVSQSITCKILRQS